MDGCPAIPLKWYAYFVLALLGFAFTNKLVRAVIKESNGLEGYWSLIKVTDIDARKEVPGVPAMLVSMKIDGGRLEVGSHWTCGAIDEPYCRGLLKVEGDKITVTGNQDDEQDVSGEVHRLPDGFLAIQHTYKDGHTNEMEFARTNNPDTFLDHMPWR